MSSIRAWRDERESAWAWWAPASSAPTTSTPCGGSASSTSSRSPASTEASARRKADALGVPKAYGSYEALAADPDVHVVHNTTPNYLHVPVILAALAARQARHLRQAAGDDRRRGARGCWTRRTQAGVVHAVTFNYRGNPLVQQARAMIAGGELGAVHFVHGAYLQDWLLEPTDFSWRLEPDKGGASSAVGDIGSHWCDLVAARHRPAHRRGARRPRRRSIDTRLKPAASTEAFAAQRRRRRASRSRSPARIWRRSSCGSTTAPRAACPSARSAPATRTTCGSRSTAGAARCAGSRSGRTSCGSAAATRPNAHAAEGSVAARAGRARPTRTCRAAIRRRGRRVPQRHARHLRRTSPPASGPAAAHPPAFATFEDGYRCGVRRRRDAREPSPRRRLDHGWPRSAGEDVDEARSVYACVRQARHSKAMLAKVQALAAGPGDRARHRRLARARSPRRRRAARRQAVRAPTYRTDDRRRRADDQRAVVPRQPAASRPRDARRPTTTSSGKTVRLAEQLEVPVVVTFSGCPGDSDDAKHPNWVTAPWPPEFLEVLDVAVGEEGDSVLARARRASPPTTASRSRSRRTRASSSTTSRRRCRLRARGGTEPRRQLRSEPLLLAGRGRADGDPRARRRDLPRARQGRRARSRRTSPSTA